MKDLKLFEKQFQNLIANDIMTAERRRIRVEQGNAPAPFEKYHNFSIKIGSLPHNERERRVSKNI